ncbi:MAG: hypothetical protein M1587_04035 [Thaumarchaeota archaeon]|nr:hypothetical protein [Nitrososphaerota archaeon]
MSETTEDKIKTEIRSKLEEQGFKVKPEVAAANSDRNVILDFYAFKEPKLDEAPEILWVECKGDVNLSELIEGFARLEFALFFSGGKGLFVAPEKQIELMQEFEDFFKQVPHIELRAIEP